MRIQITDTPWNCPECGSTLNEEECIQVRELLVKGHGQVDLKCEDCGENLAADTTELCGAGEVCLNPEWVYD